MSLMPLVVRLLIITVAVLTSTLSVTIAFQNNVVGSTIPANDCFFRLSYKDPSTTTRTSYNHDEIINWDGYHWRKQKVESRLYLNSHDSNEFGEIPMRRNFAAFFNMDNNRHKSNNASRSSSQNIFKKSRQRMSRFLVYVHELLSQRRNQVRRLLRSWQKMIRENIVEKSTIYVLECQDGKYYVGTTRNKRKRYQVHFSKQGGSAWTKQYKPLRIVAQYKRVPHLYALGLESKITAQVMLDKGVNNVRGAMFAGTQNLTMHNLETLTRFLGHYNDLDYNKIRKYLVRTLPRTSKTATKRRRRRQEVVEEAVVVNRESSPVLHSTTTASSSSKGIGPKHKDVCYACGQKGHRAANCPNIGNTYNNHDPNQTRLSSWTRAPNSTTTSNNNENGFKNGYKRNDNPMETTDNHADKNNGNNKDTAKVHITWSQQDFPSNQKRQELVEQQRQYFISTWTVPSTVNPNDVCYKCGQKGHWAKHCNAITKQQQQQQQQQQDNTSLD